MPDHVSEVQTAIKQLGDNWSEFKSDIEDRLIKLEVDRDTPYLGRNGNRMTPEQAEHSKAFEHWLRNPHSHNARSALEELQQKAFDTTANASGGHAVPTEINQQIMLRLREMNPLRQIASVVQVSTSDYREVIDTGGTSSGWVGEGDSRSETSTPNLELVQPTFGIVYAYPKATEESVADIQFNIRTWLVDRIAEEIAIAEGQAFIDGNGINKPTGLLNASPESTADNMGSPSRTFGALKYIPTGVADGFGELSTTSPTHYPADVLLTTVYDLKAAYRQNAVWLMNSTTAGTIRKFKNSMGDYLWTDGLQPGQPSMLCGYPVWINEAMPDIGSNAHPVLFGDFRRGYVIADSFTTRITVDDNISTPGYVKWYARRRVGGAVRDDHAIRAIKCATS